MKLGQGRRAKSLSPEEREEGKMTDEKVKVVCRLPWGIQANCSHATGTGHCFLTEAKRQAETFCNNRSLQKVRAGGPRACPPEKDEEEDDSSMFL